MFGSHSAWVAASLLQASSVRHLGRVNLATDSSPPAHAHECLVRLVAERGRQFGSTLQASKQLYLECRHLSIIYLSTFVPRQSRMSPRRRPVVFFSRYCPCFNPPRRMLQPCSKGSLACPRPWRRQTMNGPRSSSRAAELTPPSVPTLPGHLMRDVERGQVKKVVRWLKGGGQADQPFSAEFCCYTLLHVAAAFNRTDLINLLLKHGASIDVRSIDGSTALMVASEQGQLAAVHLLLKQSASVDLVSACDGISSLISASRNGHASVVAVLLKHSADPDQQSATLGSTALVQAAGAGHIECARVLLDAGASTTLQLRACGRTAFDLAASNGHAAVCRLLQASTATAPVSAAVNETPGRGALAPCARTSHDAEVRAADAEVRVARWAEQREREEQARHERREQAMALQAELAARHEVREAAQAEARLADTADRRRRLVEERHVRSEAAPRPYTASGASHRKEPKTVKARPDAVARSKRQADKESSLQRLHEMLGQRKAREAAQVALRNERLHMVQVGEAIRNGDWESSPAEPATADEPAAAEPAADAEPAPDADASTELAAIQPTPTEPAVEDAADTDAASNYADAAGPASDAPKPAAARATAAPVKVPDAFVCPLTLEIMHDPALLVGDGQTYERSEIERWLQTKLTSPMTNEKLTTSLLAPNVVLRRLIIEFREANFGLDCETCS